MVLVSGELHVTYEGQPTTVLKPGMYAYGPAKLAHKAVCGTLRLAFCSSLSRRPWTLSLIPLSS